MQMFKKRAAVFYRVKNHDRRRVNFRPDKTGAESLLNDFKNVPGKACLNGDDSNDAFVIVGN